MEIDLSGMFESTETSSSVPTTQPKTETKKGMVETLRYWLIGPVAAAGTTTPIHALGIRDGLRMAIELVEPFEQRLTTIEAEVVALKTLNAKYKAMLTELQWADWSEVQGSAMCHICNAFGSDYDDRSSVHTDDCALAQLLQEDV